MVTVHIVRRTTGTIRTGAIHRAVGTSFSTSAPEKKNFFLRLLGYYSDETTCLRNAEAVFQSCANQASRKPWLGRGRIPHEFRPKHALLMTHVWLVHQRLLLGESSGGSGGGGGEDSDPSVVSTKALQEAVFDRLWEDTTMRIRSMGIAELMVNKSLGDVQKYSFPLLVAYDQAMGKGSEEERNDHLGATVWRNVWMGDKFITVEHCMEMAYYVQQQRTILAATDSLAVAEGRIAWGDVPSWNGIKSVVDVPSHAAGSAEAAAASGAGGASTDGSGGGEAEEEEEGEWREALANTGKTYYWNVRTRETRWDKPQSELRK